MSTPYGGAVVPRLLDRGVAKWAAGGDGARSGVAIPKIAVTVCYPAAMIAFVLFLAVVLFLLVGKAARCSRQGGRVGGRQRVLERGRLAVQGRSLTRKAVEWAVAGDPAAACEFPQHCALFPQHCAGFPQLFPEEIPSSNPGARSPFGEFARQINKLKAARRKQKTTIFPQNREFSKIGRASSVEQGLVGYERRWQATQCPSAVAFSGGFSVLQSGNWRIGQHVWK